MTESTTTQETRDVESYIRQQFAENTGITEAELFAEGMTLAALISRSPRMTNSIDLMEAFARTANSVRKDFGVRVRLPALPLDTSTMNVLHIFLAEYVRQEKAA